jgi:tRNA-specific adenosine deaminase 2
MVNKWMDEALDLAAEALESGEVPVGCVFVYNEEAVAKGRNTVNETRNATRHAELNCMDQTAEWCMENGNDFATVMAAMKVIFLRIQDCIRCQCISTIVRGVRHRNW